VSEETPVVIAVDGGGTKTDVALVNGEGTLLALARGPGVPLRLGEATVEVIGKLVSTVVEQARAQQVAAQLVACVANVDLPAEVAQLEQMLSDQGWAQSAMVANDTYAVLRAGLADLPADGVGQYWGVGVTCGTGINCVGIAPDGRTARFLALGESTGDWGGGGSLGMAAQWHAMRADDGRGPHTALRDTVPAHFGLGSPADVAVALHLGNVSFSELAGLSPVIFRTADSGDEVARSLVLRQAEEIFLLARSAIRQLDLADAAVPVVLGGGIVAARHPLLIDRVTELITTEFPAAVVHVVTRAPVVGAALIGLDLAGASVAAKQRLRSAFTDESLRAEVSRR
jgi:N-acetylglucosamine kinase-like BadF-type ATPase